MYLVPQPLSAETLVRAAVNVVFPWSTWPIVPTFTCGLVRSNFAFAIVVFLWFSLYCSRLSAFRSRPRAEGTRPPKAGTRPRAKFLGFHFANNLFCFRLRDFLVV